MSNLKNIREKLGISQQEAAQWLGISRSLVNHYERGSRSLPTQALLQLSKLEILIGEYEKQVDGLWDTNHGDRLDSNHENRYGWWDTNHRNVTNHGDDEKISPRQPGMELPVQVPLHPRMAFELDKSARLQQQLALLESGHTKLQRQMLLIKHFMDNSHEQMTEKQRLWLQMLHDAVSYKVSKFDEARQLPLRAKIMQLELKAGRNRH